MRSLECLCLPTRWMLNVRQNTLSEPIGFFRMQNFQLIECLGRFVWTLKKGYIKRASLKVLFRVNENENGTSNSHFPFIECCGSFKATSMVCLPAEWFQSWMMELHPFCDRWHSLLYHQQNASGSVVEYLIHSYTLLIGYDRNYSNKYLFKFISFNFNDQFFRAKCIM